jgi:AAA15 family ATPase/GTPase
LISEFTIQYFKAFENVTAKDLGRLNAFVGRNNAGKSTVLHALDLAGLALRWGDWNRFQLKLKIEDLFWDRGDFALSLTNVAGQTVKISAQNRRQPIVNLGGAKKEEFDSVLIQPDPGFSMLNRQPVSPAAVMDYMRDRNYTNLNSLDILQAIQFYAKRGERGFTQKDYDDLVGQVCAFFPELDEVKSDRTENLYATLEYKEDGRTLDILYSGMGLKRFLDILIKVTLSKASIVLLDEPEYGMHPELQRRLLTFLRKLASERDLQFFMATHSPVFLNASVELEVFRVSNEAGKRSIVRVPPKLRHTIFGDLGVRPSDLFQNDICLMVEGQDDVVFFEFVLHELYQQEFAGLAVGVVQYAGDAAAGIKSGDLSIANIAGAQPCVHWIRDREARPFDPPSPQASSFVDALRAAGQSATILAKREIEFYIPEQVYTEAQGGDPAKELTARIIYSGDESQKFRAAMSASGCTVPRGSTLRSLLRKYVTKSNLDPEIREIVERVLLPWAKTLRGA